MLWVVNNLTYVIFCDRPRRHSSRQKPYNPEFFKWFWAQYDPKGYSIYTCKYKYNDENNMYFTTANLMNGFIQRLDPGRKYTMAALHITAKDEDTKPFIIGGCFLFRGQGAPAEVRVVDLQ